MTNTSPVIAVTLGDPAGIGPELIARLFAETPLFEGVHTVLVGDRWLWQEGQRVAGQSHRLPEIEDFAAARHHDGPVFLAVDSVAEGEVGYAEETAAGGASVLAVLSRCLEAAQAGEVDAICFAPLNKLSMKKGGLRHEDELHFFAERLGVEGYFCEFNTLGSLWTSRISSHIPLKDAASYVTRERIVAASELIHDSLKLAGFDAPRVAVAAFNPHGGEGGTCGREEIDVIAPAVEQCRAQGYPIDGPFPADTIFIKARDGEYDAIVTMYHDQGQIAIKLMGFKQGVTVQGGLPIPITTPAHGTAFDIAGQGKADMGPTRNAFSIACRMGANLRRQRLADATHA
ncbi:4-hydroxythreonine-4-phosphate dehydrogenase PdxA [Halomonas elongata]|uniref:4-hydroxythreonine-4-phosphate dehydrogenase n=1 Tax=Halomonas elongata (strain ATCC 33173 / DSM 2581 / NBRC 15536 / NCIMB 2198 / 1H9) TaxID=768066 RepID=E1V484_HALED|nr:4-hydroxythreonine-4-phosphate dehydrogenase PdxA [Halomonas elongata]WBF18163.1 4-hydroxythreonine-4-phosphate dehydrogenase PdxA [Halomonas elongata]WPU47014.1 4-hydroxythreonine-4-phosphate dehydrogenase PdxA [Halomonas elongata DSM 2581]CBV40921.1 4-hydroxythreonine-4-phosphate dehydrogenase [Halomonas elongata DSM 2581]